MPRRPHTGSRAPTGVRLLSPFEGSGAPPQIRKLRVYIDNKSFARRCAQGRFQISYCAANGLPPKGISEERHKRLLAEDVIDDIHALQMECRALLRCRAVPLDVFLLQFDAKCWESSTPITLRKRKTLTPQATLARPLADPTHSDVPQGSRRRSSRSSGSACEPNFADEVASPLRSVAPFWRRRWGKKAPAFTFSRSHWNTT